MPGFDGTGPMGMGSMTGGGRGPCNPYGKSIGRGGSNPRVGWGYGRGRGHRHMFWTTGLPGWMRYGSAGPWRTPSATPYTREQEAGFLRDRAAILKEELDAIDSRLRDFESEEETTKQRPV